MFKKLCATAAMTLALTSGGSALAADLPSLKGPPVYVPPPPMFTWTGFYVGLNLGGGWRDTYRNNNWGWGGGGGWGGWNNNNNSGGVVGGGQVGYNYQFSPWLVIGAETDFQGTSIGSGGGNGGGWWGGWWGGGGGGERIPWFGTVRGRVGITPFDPRLMIYGTGGFAYGEVRHDGFLGSWTRTKTGWTAGGGIEWAPAMFQNWSVKFEYLYTDLTGGNGNNGWGWGWGWGWGNNLGNNRSRFHTIRAGVNYHFGWFTPSPVVAKY